MTKPYNTDIAHVWSRVSRSFVRKGQAFKKDGFITKKKEPKPNYTGSKAGAKLRGEHKLNKKAKEWRTAYLKALELPEDEIKEALETLLETEDLPDAVKAAVEVDLSYMENGTWGKSPTFHHDELKEDEARDAVRVDLFNAILDDKPHDSKEAVDILLKDKLADGIASYKSALALKMFNPQPEAEEKPTESEPEDKEVEEGDVLDNLTSFKGASKFIRDKNEEMYGKKKKKSKNNGGTHKVDEGEPVDETLRAPGKSNQDVVTDSPVKGKKKK